MADNLSPALAASFPEFGNIASHVCSNTGSFSLKDSKSCVAIGSKPGCLSTCNQEILNILSHRRVWCISLDDWIHDTSGSQRCDYIVYDDNTSPIKMALCELTCTQETYVNPYRSKPGKRAKAINQIITTWALLSSKSAVKNEMDRYANIIGIFGWRDPIAITAYSSLPSSTPAGSMARFLRTPASTASGVSCLGSTFGSGYKIYQVKYAFSYIW